MDDTNVFDVQCLPTLFFFFPASAVLLTGTFDFFIALGILALKTLTFLLRRYKATHIWSKWRNGWVLLLCLFSNAK